MSPKILFALFLSLFLSLLSFGTALADDYEIPVIAGGKVFTISVSVSDSSIISATTKDSGVSVGRPVVKAKAVGEPGEWAKLMPDALEWVNRSEDQFTGNTFYSSKKFSADRLGSQVTAYVGTDGNKTWFRLSAILVTDKSLLFDSATALVDGKKFHLKFNMLNGTHEYLSGGTYFDADDIEMQRKFVDAVAVAKSVQIRFYTRNSTYDYTLSEDEMETFRLALAVEEMVRR